MATSRTELKVDVKADSSKVDLDPAKKSLQQVQKEAAAAKAGLASLIAEFQASRNTAVQAGTSYDKAIGEEFRKKISNARTEVSRLNAELAQGVASGAGQAGIEGKFGGLATSLTSLLTPMAAVGAAYTALNQAFRISNLADSLGDISDATGNSVGSLRTLQTTLVSAGGSVSDMDSLASKFAVSVGEAAEGNEKMIDTFRRLQVPIKDANGELRSQDDILQDAIKALAGIENPAQRAAIAVDLFGKKAKELDFTKLSALRDFKTEESVKNLNNLRGEMEKLGNYVDSVLIGIFGRLARTINETFPATTAAKVDTLTKALARAEKTSGAFSGQSGMVANLRKQLDEAKEELKREEESRLRASAGPRGGTGDAYKVTPLKDFQFGTSKKPAPAPPAPPRPTAPDRIIADLSNEQSEESKRAVNEFKFQQEQVRSQYAQNLLSVQAYYDAQDEAITRARVTEQQAFVERQKRLEAEKVRLQELQNAGKNVDAKEIQRVEDEIQKSITQNSERQLNLLTQQNAIGVNRRKDTEAYEASMRNISQEWLKQSDLANTAEGAESRRLQIQAKYAQALALANAQKNTEAAERIRQLQEYEQAAATLAEKQLALKDTLGKSDLAQLEVQQKRAAGLISDIAAEQELLRLKREQVEAQIALNEAILKGGGKVDGKDLSPSQIKEHQTSTAKLKTELAGLTPVAVDLATQVSTAFENKIGNALGDIVTGTKTAKQAFGGMLKDIANQIIRSNITDLLKNIGGKSGGGLLASLFGGIGANGASGLGTGVAGFNAAFADGGRIYGPGGPRDDRVPIMASPGEWIINAKAVSQLGDGVMQSINAGILPAAMRAFRNGGAVTRTPSVPARGFANGGLVTPASAQQDQSAPTVQIINNGTPQTSKNTEYDFKKRVLSIFTEDLQRGGAMSRQINSLTGTGRSPAR